MTMFGKLDRTYASNGIYSFRVGGDHPTYVIVRRLSGTRSGPYDIKLDGEIVGWASTLPEVEEEILRISRPRKVK
jgi:hypothetical protein